MPVAARLRFSRLAGLVLAWMCASSAVAYAAEDCGKATKRWVALRLHGPGWSPELADSVLTDLRAEVRRHGIEACSFDTQGLPAPIVTLDIEASQPAVMRLSLDVDDLATGKRPARELQLDFMPLDGHSLAVAVAADELLTSSWIRLASRPAAEPAVPSPSGTSVETARGGATPSPHQAAPPRHELALLAVAERFAGGPWSPGLDLAIRRWLFPHWALELGGGARNVLVEEAPHGRVRSRALPIALRLLAGLVPFASRARAGAAAALSARTLFYSAEPVAGAVARSQTALAIYLCGELWADIGLGRFRLRASTGAGAPLRSVTADDSGTPVGGAHGLELHGQVGVVLNL
ncbi:MAG TPA: hypothetical protein VF550_06840 [Polyangia bacterium]